MRFKELDVNLKSISPQDLAREIHDYFLLQYTLAIREKITAQANHSSMLNANYAFENEQSKNEDIGGWGVSPPYNNACLENEKKSIEVALKNEAETKALFEFIRDRFVDKFMSTTP